MHRFGLSRLLMTALDVDMNVTRVYESWDYGEFRLDYVRAEGEDRYALYRGDICLCYYGTHAYAKKWMRAFEDKASAVSMVEPEDLEADDYTEGDGALQATQRPKKLPGETQHPEDDRGEPSTLPGCPVAREGTDPSDADGVSD